MIYEQSRYETADVVPVADQDGVYHATVVETRVIEPPTSYTRHVVVQGDRLDTLAGLAYDDPELWWVIADANPGLGYPDTLVPGQVIVIPETAVTA